MRFAYLEWRGWLLVAGAVAAFAVVGLLRRRQARRRLADVSAALALVQARPLVTAAKAGLLVLAAALLGVALLGPQWGQEEETPPPPAKGRDLLVILDVSRSMLAEDARPNRLERARADALDLVEALKRQGGYRFGLIAFADRAVLLCPVTRDHRCFEEELRKASLEGVRVRGDVSGGSDGTQLADALRRANQAIPDAAAAYTDVLLISDGGDMAEDTLEAADVLARRGVPVHAVGLGDVRNGAVIPVQRPDGTAAVLTHAGQVVRTRLEEEVLREVSRRTGGRYVAAGTGYVALDGMFAEVVGGKEARTQAPEGTRQVWIHRFQWFLGPALVLLLLELLLGDGRRTGRTPWRPSYWGWVRRRFPSRDRQGALLAEPRP